ncbi:MAG: DUF6489 family protein [Alphaproteobacteria bacterium]
MKITIDIDCTPEEARRFLGLPDLAAAQADILDEFKAQTARALEGMDGEALMKLWLSGAGLGGGKMDETLSGLGDLQRAFWEGMAKAAGGAGGGKN